MRIVPKKVTYSKENQDIFR